MNNVIKVKILLLVSVLIISGLTVTMGSPIREPGQSMNTLAIAGQTPIDMGDVTHRSRQGGYVESVQATTPLAAFVGEQNVEFDIELRSLFIDDHDDTNGDNVLYNISVMGTDAAPSSDNLMRYNFQTREFENVSAPVFTWVTDELVQGSMNQDEYLLYSKDDAAMGEWKYVMNLSNQFLDADNDKTIDPEEYWAVKNGSRSFGDLVFNVLGTAMPGYYRMKFEVSYEYMDPAQPQPFSMFGVGNGSSASIGMGNDLMFNEALGDFEYYFWRPIIAPNTIPNNLTKDELADSTVVSFQKRLNTQNQQHYTGDYDEWTGIPDNNTDSPLSYFDEYSDSITRWLPNVAPADPIYCVDKIDTNFTTHINDWPVGGPIVDQLPYNVNQGNGTWEYTGFIDDIEWGAPKSHTDEVWFDFEIKSTVTPDNDLNEDDEDNDLKLKSKDGNYFTGSVFEEFFINITNVDPSIEMRDVKATLILPETPKGGLTLYPKSETASIPLLDPKDFANMNYRITIDKETPPGYYYGGLELMYTKRYPTGELDPLGDPYTIDVPIMENQYIVQFEVDFTPDMGDAKVALPGMSVRAKPTTEIDTSVGTQEFIFTISNTGNVDLYGGNKTDGNLFLDFAEFEQLGEGYYDSDADPGVELTPIFIDDDDTIAVSQSTTEPITLSIPYHWYLPEGRYRLYLDFEGYYFNDGALGDSTGFVYMEMKWLGADDDDLPRDCYVMIDENGDGDVDDIGVDSTRLTEGIYTDIYINKFDPASMELKIDSFSPSVINQETLDGGSQTFSVTFNNSQSYDMYDVYVEFDIEGYFDESYYYDWMYPTSRMNPKFYNATVYSGETWTVTFTVDDLDKMLPQGEHHMPVKYSYNYDKTGQINTVEDMNTYGIIWDTSSSPFEPYIDVNNDFMLNVGAGTRARGGSNRLDIVFVIDQSGQSSTSYFSRIRNAMDNFAINLGDKNIDYNFAIVGYRDDSALVQDLTADTTLIKNHLNSMTASGGSPGTYDAVIETIQNTLTTNQMISYRPGSTKVLIFLTDEHPMQGTTNEMTFGFAVKGEGILFGIYHTNDHSHYLDTITATGGQAFYDRNTDYNPYFSTIVDTLSSYLAGVTPGGMRIDDIKVEDASDPQAFENFMQPYLSIMVTDDVFDFDTLVYSSPINLGGRVRNFNLQIQLTNQEYVQYTDIELNLSLEDVDGIPLFTNPLGSGDDIEGTLSSTTVSPKGGQITATFNLDVITSISSGMYQVNMGFTAMNDYTKQIVTGSIPVNIRVYPVEPILIILDDSVRASVKPGESFKLTFTLKNVGDDDAREIFLTLSNDWYEDAPFSTLCSFVTCLSSHSTSYYDSGNIQNLTTIANTKLSDLGISSITDIVDAERQLLSPTAVVPRIYIENISAGEEREITITLTADTHMIPGRPYKEYILLEFIDSDGLRYTYDEANPQLSTRPLPIIIRTKDKDDWPKDELTTTDIGFIFIVVILIILIVLFVGSYYGKKKREEGEDSRGYGYDDDEYLEDEDMDDEELPEDEEEIEDELPEDIKEDDVDKKDEDWDLEGETDEEEDEPEPPTPPPKAAAKEDADWVIEEDSVGKKKGAPPAKGKAPGKAPAAEEDIEDW